MIRPLASRESGAIREALVRRGIEQSLAVSIAQGLRVFTLVFDSLDADSHESLAKTALLRGLDVVTGDGWLVLSGSSARLAGLARADPAVVPAPLTCELGTYLRIAADEHRTWRTGRGSVPVDKPVVVGIVNVTPDSFSDGGKYLLPDAAIAHAERLIEAGADMIDVGAESTRPGRPAVVPVEEEWQRLRPVLDELIRRHPTVPVSVDTVKSTIAERALSAGVWAVNDVSALRLDPRMADVCAAHGAGLVLNHSRGSFSEMAGYQHATYDDVTFDVANELLAAVEAAEDCGLNRDQIVLDPGLGFAKTPEQNCAVLRELPVLAATGLPIMVGPSRKRFLGTITGKDVSDRDTATAAACVAALFGGAYLFRVHDVARVRQSLVVAEALRSA